jgi:hypothetical protein
MDDMNAIELDGLRFSIEKSLRYHQRRRAFFETVHRILMLMVIILGSAAATSIFGTSSTLLALMTALVGAFDLVWAPGSKARDHLVLHQRFSALTTEILRTPNPSPRQIVEWSAKRVEIETDEPPIYWALERDCYNEVCHAWGRDQNPNALNKLSHLERWFMNFYRFDQATTA